MGNGTLFNFICNVKDNMKCLYYIVLIIPVLASRYGILRTLGTASVNGAGTCLPHPPVAHLG